MSQNLKSDIYLFTLEGTFLVTGRGLVLVPGVKRGTPAIRVGQIITILKPDGQEFKTFIKEFFMGRQLVASDSLPIILPKNITLDDLPTGCQVCIRFEDQEN